MRPVYKIKLNRRVKTRPSDVIHLIWQVDLTANKDTVNIYIPSLFLGYSSPSLIPHFLLSFNPVFRHSFTQVIWRNCPARSPWCSYVRFQLGSIWKCFILLQNKCSFWLNTAFNTLMRLARSTFISLSKAFIKIHKLLFFRLSRCKSVYIPYSHLINY